MSEIDLSKLSAEEKLELIRILEERVNNASANKIKLMYPDTGPLRRELYAKHMEFFAAGKDYRERCFMAANRVGKTEGAGGYETALHLTGQYPDWWPGRRFPHEIDAWVAGKTNETTRDIVQQKLFGRVTFVKGEKCFSGTGLIPRETIGKIAWKSGTQDLADTVEIKHLSGFTSKVGLKSYQQGRGAFEGTEKHVVWLDEEPPLEIYDECKIRTATVGGMVYMTYTPLEGASDTVMLFLPPKMLQEFADLAKRDDDAEVLKAVGL
jgi:phage terminase large subunit-like protein